jgi:hypothetical protein
MPGRPAALPKGTPFLPADDLFTATYAGVLTIEGGGRVDVAELRARLDRFRSEVGRLRIPADRRRWVQLAAALEGALEELEVGSPKDARRRIKEGLSGFVRGD